MTGASEIMEAFGETQEEVTAPVALGLREVVPAPPQVEAEKLASVSARHRVLLVRAGAVIAVTTLISVGGALLIHLLLAGVIAVGFWFPGTLSGDKRGPALPGIADVGGSPGGFTILGNGPDDNAAPAPEAPTVLGNPTPGMADTLPKLPESLAPTSTVVPAMVAMPAPALPDLSGTFIQPPQAAPSATATPLPAVTVAPPGVANAGASSLTPGMPARGTEAGDGGGDDDRMMSLVKGDGGPGSGGGGVGSGRGMGRGNGINRGLSAADREPQLLSLSRNANFTLPLKYQLKPPEKSVRLILAVAADGSIAAVRLDQSCGISELDQMVSDYVLANFQFSPAYRAGKAIAAEFPFEMSFKPFD